MSPSPLFFEILSDLNNYRFKEVEMRLNQWESQPLPPQELKQVLHLRGIMAFYKDDLEGSGQFFSQASKKETDYLEFHLDYASFLYTLGQWDQWRDEYGIIEDLLDSEEEVQSPKAWILLSKFYEEEGLISKSLKALQTAYSQAVDHANPIRKSILVQLLRIESTFLFGKNVGTYYSQLIQIQNKNLSKEFEIETEHALMLGELSLVGPQHACERLLSALNRDDISNMDSNFLLSDFLEECLINNYSIPEIILNKMSQFSSDFPFEKILLNLCSPSKKPSLNIGELMKLAPELSVAGYLRVLILSIKVLPGLEKELKNKIHLLFSSVDADSRHSWTLRLDKYLETSNKRVIYDEKKRVLEYENKSVDLSRKRGMLLFFEALSKHPEASIEDMIHTIWQSDYSPDHFHRLRMTAHRMNKVLYDLTSIEKAIEVNSDQVRIKSNLVIDRGASL